jgi:hypothetical protein
MNGSGNNDEARRDFFKSVGRGAVLGLIGIGAGVMVKTGRLSLTRCIDETSPCNRCLALPAGCGLPKAASFRQEKSRG